MTGLPPRIPKAMKLNEVRFNGEDGKFFYVDVINRKEGEKAVKTDLGDHIDFIFLRTRRRIAGYIKKDKMMYISTEHNDKKDNVYLFGAREKGTAEELYDRYKDIMHTERVVYAFLIQSQKEKELVRIIIKGSTLNWKRDGKAPTTVDYFAYVQDDKREGHIYEYVTRITPVKETGDLGDYYSMHFALGAHLDQPKIDVIVEKLKELKEYVAEQDSYYKTAKKVEEVDVPVIDATDKVEYPAEQINPDDIPF